MIAATEAATVTAVATTIVHLAADQGQATSSTSAAPKKISTGKIAR